MVNRVNALWTDSIGLNVILKEMACFFISMLHTHAHTHITFCCTELQIVLWLSLTDTLTPTQKERERVLHFHCLSCLVQFLLHCAHNPLWHLMNREKTENHTKSPRTHTHISLRRAYFCVNQMKSDTDNAEKRRGNGTHITSNSKLSIQFVTFKRYHYTRSQMFQIKCVDCQMNNWCEELDDTK